MTYPCGSVLGRPCSGEKDCYSFWAKFHFNLLAEYGSQGNVKLVRIEDLVVPEPASKEARATAKCMLEFVSLSASKKSIEDALLTMHGHRGAYMGHHYGANWLQRSLRVAQTRWHADPLVREMMLRFGYNPKAFQL